MIIEFEDITLRAIEEEDSELLRDMLNDPETEYMTLGYSFAVSSLQQSKWFQNFENNRDEIRFIIDTQKHGAIGSTGLTNIDWKNRNALIYLKLTRKNNIRGNGYGTKAMKAMIKYSFEELNLHCLTTNNMEYNIAIEKIKEKCGFVKEGVLRDRVFKKGKYHNTHIWSLINDIE